MLTLVTNAVASALMIMPTTSGIIEISDGNSAQYVAVNKGTPTQLPMSDSWINGITTNGYADFSFRMTKPFKLNATEYVDYDTQRERFRRTQANGIRVVGSDKADDIVKTNGVAFSKNKRLYVSLEYCAPATSNTNECHNIDRLLETLLTECENMKPQTNVCDAARGETNAVSTLSVDPNNVNFPKQTHKEWKVRIVRKPSEFYRGKPLATYDYANKRYVGYPAEEVEKSLNRIFEKLKKTK